MSENSSKIKAFQSVGAFTVKHAAALTILIVCLVVIFRPATVFAATPKVVLFVVTALMVAAILGAEVVTKFELKLPGFTIVAMGSAGIVFALLFTMDHLAKPEAQIVVVSVFDEENNPVSLEGKNAFETLPSSSGLKAQHYTDGNVLVLVFPEQLAEMKVRIKTHHHGRIYTGTIRYAGNRVSELILGTDLTAVGD